MYLPRVFVKTLIIVNVTASAYLAKKLGKLSSSSLIPQSRNSLFSWVSLDAVDLMTVKAPQSPKERTPIVAILCALIARI